MNTPKKESKKPEINQAVYDDMSEKLKQIMGTKVQILPKTNEKGKIEIEYYSGDELERIIDLFMSTR
jgi:ParB family chromosome partitioning protein